MPFWFSSLLVAALLVMASGCSWLRSVDAIELTSGEAGDEAEMPSGSPQP